MIHFSSLCYFKEEPQTLTEERVMRTINYTLEELLETAAHDNNQRISQEFAKKEILIALSDSDESDNAIRMLVETLKDTSASEEIQIWTLYFLDKRLPNSVDEATMEFIARFKVENHKIDTGAQMLLLEEYR